MRTEGKATDNLQQEALWKNTPMRVGSLAYWMSVLAAREGACSVGKGKGLPWGRGKILVQKEEQEDRKGVLCGGKWE